MAAIPGVGERRVGIRIQELRRQGPGGPGTQNPQGQLTPRSGYREGPGELGLECLGKCCCLSVLRSLRTHSEPTSGSSQDAGGQSQPTGAVGRKNHCQGEGRLRPASQGGRGFLLPSPCGPPPAPPWRQILKPQAKGAQSASPGCTEQGGEPAGVKETELRNQAPFWALTQARQDGGALRLHENKRQQAFSLEEQLYRLCAEMNTRAFLSFSLLPSTQEMSVTSSLLQAEDLKPKEFMQLSKGHKASCWKG